MIIFKDTNETDNYFLFITQIVIISLLALPILYVDIKFQKYRINYKLTKIQRINIIIIQILLGSIYLHALFKMMRIITDQFQTTLPGMYFSGIFYSLQYNLFLDIYDLIIPIV